MYVFLLFVYFQVMPNDSFKTHHLVAVYDSKSGCERAAVFYQKHLVADADVVCVQRVVEK